MIFSTTLFSSAPYSALGETLVEIDANLENFSLIDSSSLISIFSESIFLNDSKLLSSAQNRFYSSYEFLGNSNLDLSSKIKSYNLSIFESRFQSFQSAIIKLSNAVQLNNIGNLAPSDKIKINELANFLSTSGLDLTSKIKVIGSSGLLVEALLILIQTGANSIFGDSEFKNATSLINSSVLKFYSSKEFNSFANIAYNPKLKFYNLSNLDNVVVLSGAEKLNVTAVSDLEVESELFSQYLNKSHGSIDLNSEPYFFIDAYLKNYNLSTLNAIVNIQPFAKLSFSGSGSNFQILTEIVSDSKIKIVDSIDLNAEATFLSNYLSRTVGNLIASVDSNVLFYPNYKTYGNWIIESNIEFFPSAISKFYNNLSNMTVVGVLTTNLSQRNRDVVYYILAIDQERPFELQILRSK